MSWEGLGCPVYVASPMVDSSEHAFRVLCRRYGAHLCYTPMLNAKAFVEDVTYRRQRFDIQLDEGPTIAQLAGDNPELLASAALIAQNLGAAGIDLNLGCPQPIARKGHYGSALLRETDLIVESVRAMVAVSSIPISCKIRIIDEGGLDPNARGLQATLRLVDQIESAGATFLTVHGRNRLMTGKKTGQADWEAIAAIKKRLSIPIVANGNIESFDDIGRCLEATGANAVMSAEALLENPSLFSGRAVSPFLLAMEYLELATPTRDGYVPIYDFNKCIKAHVARILHAPVRAINRQILRFKALGNLGLETLPDDCAELIARCTSVDELIATTHRLENLCLTKFRTSRCSVTPITSVGAVNEFGATELSAVAGVKRKVEIDESCSGEIGLDISLQHNEKVESIPFQAEANSSDISVDVSSSGSLEVNDTSTFEDSNDGEDAIGWSVADTWYRRHRIGSIEQDRSKRKEQQRLWLATGLRMSR